MEAYLRSLNCVDVQRCYTDLRAMAIYPAVCIIRVVHQTHSLCPVLHAHCPTFLAIPFLLGIGFVKPRLVGGHLFCKQSLAPSASPRPLFVTVDLSRRRLLVFTSICWAANSFPSVIPLFPGFALSNIVLTLPLCSPGSSASDGEPFCGLFCLVWCSAWCLLALDSFSHSPLCASPAEHRCLPAPLSLCHCAVL